MKKRVTYAKLHEVTFLPGVGEVPNTLPPTGKTWDLKMYLTNDYIDMTVNGFKAIIPLTMVKLAAYVEEQEPAKESKGSKEEAFKKLFE